MLLFYLTVDLKDVMFSVPVQPDEDVDSGSIWKENIASSCISPGFHLSPGTSEIADLHFVAFPVRNLLPMLIMLLRI